MDPAIQTAELERYRFNPPESAWRRSYPQRYSTLWAANLSEIGMQSTVGRRVGALLIATLALTACAHQPKPVAAQAQPPSAPPPPPDMHALYDQAITDAAVKKPSFVVNLTPITAKGEVRLITLHREDELPVNPKTQVAANPVWVVLPDELAARCAARKGDPLLALLQILGMPPDDSQKGVDWELSILTVPVKRVFRPCASSPDVTTTQCTLDIAKANGSQADFVYHQTWESYRTGGATPGHPFTGMGWTYDWGPGGGSHVGVSEYVVRPGTRITKVEDLTPQEFCLLPDAAGAANVTQSTAGTAPPKP